jgi:hypothetical protein
MCLVDIDLNIQYNLKYFDIPHSLQELGRERGGSEGHGECVQHKREVEWTSNPMALWVESPAREKGGKRKNELRKR